ncbi:hypothetical protein ABIB94_009072 [Bradyrhizobium sp. JR7.2]|uniref:hypothetical protein n=1 Tax=Bradyrhizobium sp. JR7.2 TaxID=3156375 RepID=UPI0033969723
MILDQLRRFPHRRAASDHLLDEPTGMTMRQHQRPAPPKKRMLEMAIREPMIDVHEAADAARESVADTQRA